MVQLRPLLHEQPHVADVQRAAHHEDAEHHRAVEQQHQPEHHDVERREHHAQAAARQEVLYASVVVDALQDVARHLRVEVAHGQAHQLGQEVRYEGDVHPRAQVEQYPAADELHRRAAEGQRQLRHQYQPDEPHVLVVDAEVHHALRQEGQQQLDAAAQQQPQYQLSDELLVRPQVGEHEQQPPPVPLPLVPVILLRIELRRRFQEQGDARVLPVPLRAEPAPAKLLLGIFQFLRPRVSHPHMFVVHAIHHHKMLLVPVYDAGQRRFPQPLVVYLHT